MNASTINIFKAYDRDLNLIFILMVVAAYVQAFITPSEVLTLPVLLLMIGVGVVFTLMGIFGVKLFERSATPWVRLCYFIIQIALLAGLNVLTPFGARLWMMPMPLIAQGVIMLPRRLLVLGSGLIMAVYLIPGGQEVGWKNVAAFALSYLAIIFFVAVFTHILVSEHRARAEVEMLAAELTRANEKLRGYAVQVEELATTKERNRLAREIHDSLGHYLTVVNVQLEAARAVLDTDRDQARDALAKAQTLTKEGLEEVRRSVAALRAPLMEGRSLLGVIETLLEECRAAGLICELAVTGSARQLPTAVEQTLYRTVQEGLTNIRKHARASRVDVSLDFVDEDRVWLKVEDNGVGTEEERLDEGFGLLGLRERIQLLGGMLQVHTGKNQGFRLVVEVPL